MVWALKSRRGKTKPRVPEGQRIYAVGDVHGRADLLLALLGRIDADLRAHPTAQPIQVFLGDYIDRGPDSRHVLDLLVWRKEEKTETVFLKGNHEAYACQVLNDPSALAEWQQMGGTPTLLSYGLTPSSRSDPKKEEDIAIAFRQAFPAHHHRFVKGLALSFTCGDFFFAHAGVRPGVSLRLQRQEDLLWIRDDFLLHEDTFGKIVVHGHTPTTEPDIRPNRINIDTGAYATGRLTCLVLEADQMRFL
ncbi:MAG TPA: metallophosphoesterase family protein [Xanthobacteraceae bacterium]|nr:metallophosphoesterase family protein [Xanthobacteraceae bacterium]